MGTGQVDIGYVSRPHGVRGEVRVVLHNPDSTALERAETVTIGDRVLAVSGARAVRGAVLLRLAEIGDRNAAESLREKAVWVDREALDLEEDEFLLSDLVGCRVALTDGSPWGQIAAVISGAQDRLVVHDGDVERELPFVDALVVEIDLEERRVVVDPPEGLPEWPRP